MKRDPFLKDPFLVILLPAASAGGPRWPPALLGLAKICGNPAMNDVVLHSTAVS